MSREIKFRARCTEDTDYIVGPVVCRMLKGEFIYGWLTDGFIIQHKQPFPIDQNTIGQFTGLTDKHGKEIYEGCILKSSYGIPQVPMAIQFEASGFYALSPGHTPDKCLLSEFIEHLGEVEVIGNIYENPDLMQFNK